MLLEAGALPRARLCPMVMARPVSFPEEGLPLQRGPSGSSTLRGVAIGSHMQFCNIAKLWFFVFVFFFVFFAFQLAFWFNDIIIFH